MIRALLFGAALGLAAPVSAQALDDGFDALARPGTVALMRHALAPGGGDPAEFRIDDCATQRNLDDRGRAQARAIGDALRAADVAFDQVWASLWCRSYDTASLIDMGPVVPFPPLNSFFGNRETSASQTEDVQQALAKLTPDTRVLLVTHQVNITALTGVRPRSGEIVILQREGDSLTVVDRVLIEP